MTDVSNMLSCIDLFCGAGGLSFGFQKAGFNVIAGLDFDEASLKTFVKNHKNSESIHCDISKTTNQEITRKIQTSYVDVVIGGPPCQGMSHMNTINNGCHRKKKSFIYLTFTFMTQDEIETL